MSSNNTISRGPTLFAPTQLPGCAMWLDAADTSTYVLSGNNLTQWNDKSSNALVLAQATASNQPTLGPLLNNLQTIQFTTAQRLIATNTLTSLPAQSQFIVFNAYNNANNNRFMFAVNSDFTVTGGQYFYGGNGTVWANRKSGNLAAERAFYDSVGLGVTPYNSGQWYITNVVDSNTTTDINSFLFRIDGTTRSITLYNGSILSGSATINVTINQTAQAANNYLSEVIFYNTALSVAQVQQVEGYLAWKWGLVGNLPAGHPYKNTPVLSITSLPPQVRNVGTIPLASSSTPFSFYNPNTISGVQLWLDAADRSTITLSGSNITQWRDKSPNAFTVSSNGSDPPGTVLGTKFNSLPVVSFPSNSQMNVTMAIPNSTTRSLFYVIRASSAGSSLVMPLGSLSANGNESYFAPNATSTGFSALDMQGIDTTCYFSYTGGSTQDTIFMLGAVAGTAGTINGNTQTITRAATANFATTSVTYTISRSIYTRTWELGEMILFNVNLGTAQRQQIEGYLAWKWGLSGNLPSNHPFKNNPPGLPIAVVPPRLTMANRGFSPLTIGGTALWLDAADPATVIQSGGSVSQWNDKSGNGRNGTLFNLNAPTYSSNGIVFSGTQALSTSLTASSTTESGFIVCRFTNFSVNSTLLGSINGQGGRQFRGGTDATIQTIKQDIVGVVFTGAALSANTLYLLEYVNNGTTLTHYLNSSTYASGSTVAYDAGLTTGIGGRLQVGGGLQEALTGVINEIIVFSAAVQTPQRQQIEGYLAWKWGLQGNLPRSHPFKLFPPPPS